MIKCLTPENGECLWELRLPDRIESSPATAIINHSNISQSAVVLIGCFDFCLYALCLQTGVIKWSFKTEGIVKCTPLFLPPTAVYFGSYDHYFYKLDLEFGSLSWKVKIRYEFNVGYLSHSIIGSFPRILK